MSSAEIELRPMTSEDLPFLLQVYAGTRAEELAAVPWSDAEKEQFVRMQFEAQHTFYQQQFPDAAYDLVVVDGEAIGRLYVDRRTDEIRLIDIALLPEKRRGGVGSRLLAELLAEGQAAGLPVRIHVEKNNPALSLYHRLGFEELEDQGVYYLMEWSPR
ncbi:MAG: GNAT family N-acetyltransferase [Acidobacteriota bacterium]